MASGESHAWAACVLGASRRSAGGGGGGGGGRGGEGDGNN